MSCEKNHDSKEVKSTGPVEEAVDVRPDRSPSRIMVGKPAPDFTADAFVEGGFKKISLSDYRGKWVVLCFYPGDFTFV